MIIKLKNNIYNLNNFKQIGVEDLYVRIDYAEPSYCCDGETENYYSIIDTDYEIFDDIQTNNNYDHKDMRWIKSIVTWKIYNLIWKSLCNKVDVLDLDDVFENMCNEAQVEYEAEFDED